MEIKSFSIKNFRSINETKMIQLSDYSPIIGQNNAGKSNLLKGLLVALTLISRGIFSNRRRFLTRNIYRYDGEDYIWERDIPFHLHEKADSKTVFLIRFILNDEEKTEFKNRFNISLDRTIPLKLQLGKRESSFDIPLKVKFPKAIKDDIALFLKSKLDFQYIPCVRTVELSTETFEEMVAREIEHLEDNEDYHKAFETIKKIQSETIKKLGEDISNTVSSFIPEVNSIRFNLDYTLRRRFGRSVINVDDGIETQLEAKGDGIKSLTAIALMQHTSKNIKKKKSILLCVEEPESHLHPKAIHELKKILKNTSSTSQVVLTTHSPILAERYNISSNIIVANNSSRNCKSIKEIRDLLGVQVQDNLISSEFVLIVEGESDRRILERILSEKSELFKKSLESGKTIIDVLGGASKTSYKTSLYKNLLYKVYVFLDNDNAGTNGIQKALDNSILESSEYNLAKCLGKKNSEIEDLIAPSTYLNNFNTKFGINIDIKSIQKNNKTWSEFIENEYVSSGKIWDSEIEIQMKTFIADIVVQKGISVFHPSMLKSIDTLISNIESILSDIDNNP